jgi:hypothetical protein
MIVFYQSTTNINTSDNKHSRLSSGSRCTNCVATKKQGNSSEAESRAGQIRIITDYEIGEFQRH